MSLLGGIGSGLTEFAHLYTQQKHDEEDRKREAKMMQLQGLHALLSQNDLPMDVYVKTIGSMADLTGFPPAKEVADQLRQRMDQQVAAGPEKETAQSHVNQLRGLLGQQSDQSQGLEASPLPPRESAPSMVRAGELPRNVYNQVQGLPAQIALRQASMKPSQMMLPDGRTALVGPDGSVIGIVNAKPAAVFNAENRDKAAADRLQTRIAADKMLVGARATAKAQAEVASNMAAGMTQEQAVAAAADKLKQESAIRLGRAAVLAEQVKAIPAGVAQRWQALDDRDIQMEIARDLANNRIGQDQFDAETKPLFNELSSTRDLIEALVKSQPKSGSPEEQQLKIMQQYETDLLKGIYAAKGRYTGGAGIKPPPSSKSSTNSRGRAGVRLTEAEIRAAGGSDADVQEAKRKGVLAP